MNNPLLRCSLLVLGLVAGQVLAGASHAEGIPTPPKNLKLVGDHWTPWDPPQVGPDAYIIVQHDTLWDLAGRWLGDPYLWPQVWDENRYIIDSHWIYPGDPLVIPARPTVVPAQGPLPVEETPPPQAAWAPADEPPIERAAPAPAPAAPPPPPLLPLASAADVYCSGRIEPRHEPSALRIRDGDDEKLGQAQGDVVYLGLGGGDVAPGDEFAIVRAVRSVLHPVSARPLGLYIQRLGKLRVLLVHGESATAVIELACEEIFAGDELVPWSEIPIPFVEASAPFDRFDTEPSGGPTGRIVASGPQDTILIGAGQVVHIDLGQEAGLRPGDMVTLFRPRAGSLPRLNLGQAVVLTVEPDTSTVKVTRSRREMAVGDWVELAQAR